MPYKYTPPPAYAPEDSRKEIRQEFARWNEQAGAHLVTDWDLPMFKPGVAAAAVTFQLRGLPVTVRVDKWGEFAVNLRCCYLVICDMRLAEARGVDEAMREAYLQLPAPAKHRDPWEILGVRPDADLADIEAMFRIKARRLHPDAGGNNEAMQELNAAWDAIRAQKSA